MLNSTQLIELQRKRREAGAQDKVVVKQCVLCQTAKPVAEFAISNLIEDGLEDTCIVCYFMEKAQNAIDVRVLQDVFPIKTESAPVLGGFISKEGEDAPSRASRKYQFLFKFKRRWAKADAEGIELVKHCAPCGQAKPISAFEVDAYEDDGLRATCMACVADRELIAREQAATSEHIERAEVAQDAMEGSQGVSK